MAESVNKVSLVGNLGRDPEIRTFPSGDQVANVTIATTDRWRDKNTGSILRQSEAYAETLAEAMLNVFDCWLDPSLFDSKFEFAVRSWALQDQEVARRVAAADETRLEALRRMLARWGHAAVDADVRARTIYLTQIGYISMRAQENMETRIARIPTYVGIYTGEDPEPREMARFAARLRANPPT